MIVAVIASSSMTTTSVSAVSFRGLQNEVMCPMTLPATPNDNDVQCPNNIDDVCNYDVSTGDLDQSSGKLVCECMKIVGQQSGSEDVYLRSCNDTSSSSGSSSSSVWQVMCPIHRPRTGGRCNANTLEYCLYDDGNTQIDCGATLTVTTNGLKWRFVLQTRLWTVPRTVQNASTTNNNASTHAARVRVNPSLVVTHLSGIVTTTVTSKHRLEWITPVANNARKRREMKTQQTEINILKLLI
jgi:hypothetical protein